MSKDEALKLALDALGEIEWSNNSQWQSDRAKVAITALQEALAEQPAQKRPQNCGTGYCSCIECVMEPAQRTWVGLTIEEIASCCIESTTTQLSFAQELEAKLRSKNT